MQQMTIWDLLPSEKLDNIPESDMVKRIGEAIGVKFQRDDFLGGYKAKTGRLILTAEYDRYFVSSESDEATGDLFISVGIEDKRNRSGMAAPCDTTNEAIEWFRRKTDGLDRYQRQNAAGGASGIA